MIVQSIELEKFRNYKSLKLKFDSGTNIFYGDNAQGKTNILEAVYLCGTTKSHRGSKDREVIQFQEEESHLRMKVERNNVPIEIDMHLKKNKPKGIAINGVPIRKASELFGIANFVFFSPEDLNIIKDGPSVRRHFIDMELCQLHKVYLHHLSNYNKVINQRNRLLKESAFRPDILDTLDIWDIQMAEYGKKVIEERRAFIRRLNEIIDSIHGRLTGEKEHLRIIYEENVTAEEFAEALRSSREKDLRMKMSMTGPHRDDICFQTNGVDIRKFGSQGQQRTAALSLKLSEIELVKQEIGDTPILLLDDVLSELDSSRQKYLLDSIHDIQTFITCTGLDDFVQNRFHINKVFHVVEGKVYEN
ncbi:DNA replication and repair protein RecF [Marvinbryantia formatexigens DSM 14469]|uniref:DNA replication and repair protein RecF n=1 Tax=Marvinbryantia formatexigens DSM 14469 TaxID=478749 RepID=C6LKK6_9FIRM|nr:DNA replication/repair protein RecF [Marvinbryantia formatexigens]EET58905.1 DNA replication and repair protein RecF [Marvinbryantia formatexigens DSM 14469]UWO26707.1 DNA replication/repair protein RecF [Marvinbryantia formatexigens DSM 14469]SDG88709.1 DNA replication and repair protein RecF [Marvinbryantia formatexigens]